MQMHSESLASDIKPALLTRSEIEWLFGDKQVSNNYARFMKSAIKDKLKTFFELEMLCSNLKAICLVLV